MFYLWLSLALPVLAGGKIAYELFKVALLVLEGLEDCRMDRRK